MSAQPPGEVPDQSGFSANYSSTITPKHNEPTKIKDEPTEPTLLKTIPQSNNMQQTDNPKQSEAKSVLGSNLGSKQGPPNINDGKLGSGDSMATEKVSQSLVLSEIEKEVENLHVSLVVVKNKTESLKNLMAYAASSDSEGEEVCINITYC